MGSKSWCFLLLDPKGIQVLQRSIWHAEQESPWSCLKRAQTTKPVLDRQRSLALLTFDPWARKDHCLLLVETWLQENRSIKCTSNATPQRAPLATTLAWRLMAVVSGVVFWNACQADDVAVFFLDLLKCTKVSLKNKIPNRRTILDPYNITATPLRRRES
jgi:hypothetical protein